ncbi:MAG: O-antigen ligase family protein [Chloroflexi bacterium]|nr:O-antigen ligase family protein [Chloroflexota bacterium]
MLVRPANNSGSALQNLYVILSLLVGVGLGILVVRVPDSLQLIVIVVGVFAFAAAIYRVHWGLILLIIITYLNLSDIAIEYYGAPSITKLFSVLLLFGFILRWLIYGEKPKNWGLYTVLLGAYGIVALISLFFAADQLVAQAALLDFVKDAVLSIMIVLLLKERVDLRRIVWALLLCGIIMGTLSIVQYVTGSYDNEFGGFAKTPDVRTIVGSSIVENRATGPLGDPNVYAQVLLVIVPIALDRAWNTKSRRLRFFALWALFATSGAVILTFSRGAFISLMVMIIAMLIYLRPKPMALMVTLASGILLLQFVPAQYTQRMESLFSFLPWADSGTSSDSSFRGRTSEMIVG